MKNFYKPIQSITPDDKRSVVLLEHHNIKIKHLNAFINNPLHARQIKTKAASHRLLNIIVKNNGN